MRRYLRAGVLTLLIGVVLPACATQGAKRLENGEGDLTTSDGVRLHYRVAGRGPVLLLLHGGPGSNMNAVYPDLAPLANDFTFVMYDQRGGGQSEAVADLHQLDAATHVRDLEEVRSHFGLTRFALFGESWGSGLAAMYAARYPEHVSRIVFLGPMPPSKELSTQRLDSSDSQMGLSSRLAELRAKMATASDPKALCHDFFAAYQKPLFVDPGKIARRQGDSCNTSEAGIRSYFAINQATIASLGDWDFRPLLHTLKMPALVVEGQGSTQTVPSATAWASALANGRLVLVPDAGHFPQVEQPEIFFSTVRAFLQGK